MKNLTLSKDFNFKLDDILSIANYSLDSINFLHTYETDSPKSIYEIILELTNKLIINGIITIEILDLKLASQHFLSGSISEQEFLFLVRSCANRSIDISMLASAIKENNSIQIKNISQTNYITIITIERLKLS